MSNNYKEGSGANKIKPWDIEATNLSANFGYILCIGIKNLGEKNTRCYSVDDYPLYKKDPTNDSALLEDAAKDLADSGAWVTWYGGGFDVPFVQTRLLYHGMKPLPMIPHIDGWRIAKYKMKLNSNRLATVSSFLDIEEKTPLNGPIWIKASAGDNKALQYIKEHCVQDVIVLEQAFNRIKPLMSNSPNLSLLKSLESRGDGVQLCPICASPDLQMRGRSITATGSRQRFQCKDCGGWSRGRVERVKGLEART